MNNESLQGPVASPSVPSNEIPSVNNNQNVTTPNIVQNSIPNPVPDVSTVQQNNIVNSGIVVETANNVSEPVNTVSENINNQVEPVLEFDLPSNNIPTQNTVSEGTISDTSVDTPLTDEVNTNNIIADDITNNVSIPSTIPVKKYLGYMFLYNIFPIGLIFLVIHAFSKKDLDIKNYAKAYLIFMLIILGLISVLFFIAVSVLGFSFEY